MKYAEEINDTLRLATILNNIGANYSNKISTQERALSLFKTLPLVEVIGDDDGIGAIMVGTGESTLKKEKVHQLWSILKVCQS